jgi:hypothetical protein
MSDMSDRKMKIERIAVIQQNMKKMKAFNRFLPIRAYRLNNFIEKDPETILKEIEAEPDIKIHKLLHKAINTPNQVKIL